MRKIFLGLALVFCSVATFAATESAVLKLSGLLKSFSTYQANFKQQTFTQSGRLTQTSSGVMMIKRPGMFRWVSNKPTKQIMIASGDTLWIYDVDLQQATKQRLSSRTRIDPAMLLSGSVKNLESAFIVTMKSKKGQTTFTLKPKDSDYGFGKVDMIFDNKKLTAMTVLNNLSQTTEFKFGDIKLDASLPDSLFNFKPPKGVDVISQ